MTAEAVVDGLDVVPVEVAEEDAVVAGVIFGPLTWCVQNLDPRSDGRPVDSVARFHLGNAARLERLNWLGDTPDKGLREAQGLMVNYLYDLRFIEANHEAFANHGTVVASEAVRRYLPAMQPSEKIG